MTWSATAPITVAEVLGDPYRCARHLQTSGIYGLVGVEVRLAEPGCAILWLTLDPWAPMAERGYPTELVAIAVWSGGRILAVPHHAAARRWLHRNRTVFGELCLWFPRDPRALRWEWADGLVAYITIVHRHLQAEEFWRRHGHWPSEDAPHGDGDHPICSVPLRRLAEGRSR